MSLVYVAIRQLLVVILMFSVAKNNQGVISPHFWNCLNCLCCLRHTAHCPSHAVATIATAHHCRPTGHLYACCHLPRYRHSCRAAATCPATAYGHSLVAATRLAFLSHQLFCCHCRCCRHWYISSLYCVSICSAYQYTSIWLFMIFPTAYQYAGVGNSMKISFSSSVLVLVSTAYQYAGVLVRQHITVHAISYSVPVCWSSWTKWQSHFQTAY